jgi:hypothetical protein
MKVEKNIRENCDSSEDVYFPLYECISEVHLTINKIPIFPTSIFLGSKDYETYHYDDAPRFLNFTEIIHFISLMNIWEKHSSLRVNV